MHLSFRRNQNFFLELKDERGTNKSYARFQAIYILLSIYYLLCLNVILASVSHKFVASITGVYQAASAKRESSRADYLDVIMEYVRLT